MANFFDKDDDLNIWQIGSGPQSYPPPRRVAFQAVGDGLGSVSGINQNNDLQQDRLTPRTIPGRNDDPAQSKIITTATEYAYLFAENVLSHPFIVLRRVCQVSRKSSRYHLTPFTILALGAKIQRLHGTGSLWKGIGSALVVRGLIVLTESCISEVTALPKDLSASKLTSENVAKHLTLKAIAIVIVTPFFCSSLLETVQSSITNESPSLLDCVREGVNRASHWQMSRSTRLLPIWLLIGPTVVYTLCHYTIYSGIKSTCEWVHEKCTSKDRAVSQTEKADQASGIEATSALLGNIAADVVMFPLETILCRMCLQGTRTLIDNVDPSGIVTPVISDYDGIGDCYRTIVLEEGKAGLFKGFGALILQYTFQYGFIKLTKLIIQKSIPAFEQL